MDFTKVPYTRPNFDDYETAVVAATDRLKAATSGEQAQSIAKQVVALMNTTMTQQMLANIRHTIDTRDAFYSAEDDYWNEFGPQYDAVETTYLEALVASPYQEALGEIYPHTYIEMAKNKLRLQKPEAIALRQKDNQLTSQYTNLIASAQIPFNGETLTLAQLGKYMSDPDRALRKQAGEAHWQFFYENEAKFDEIYDQMVKVRTELAHVLGFADYSEMSYVYMNRFGYDEKMVATYRKTVEEKLVPLVQAQRDKQAKRLGVDHLASYDLGVQFKTGNAAPVGTPSELVEKARQMYHALDPKAGEFFDQMVEDNLLDLVAKPGKASGGYAEFIPGINMPFIFANFNGTSGDVDVLTHEAGHAFQTYLSRWIKPGDSVFPTFEAAEIFSMSMEFITYPWMQSFFEGQTDKYLYAHLQGALEFLPYGILVDHFQHEVYTHPDWTPEERKQAWKALAARYIPDRDYSDLPGGDHGVFWFRQGHIFQSPFYYLDYTIAQILAYEFWYRFNVEKDDTAWHDYVTMATAGGSQTLMELIETGHLHSPFEPGALDPVVDALKQALDAVDDQALDR